MDFLKNKENNINENNIDSLCESLNINSEAFINVLCEMLRTHITVEEQFKINDSVELKEKEIDVIDLIGRHRHVSDDSFDAEQLAKGMKIEREHINDLILNDDLGRLIAKEIAKDHLAEIPDYYSRLIEMEKEGRAANAEDALVNDSSLEDITNEMKKYIQPMVKEKLSISDDVSILVVDENYFKSDDIILFNETDCEKEDIENLQ